jgi:hypothetical protein
VVTVRVSLVRSGAAGCMRGFLQKRKARMWVRACSFGSRGSGGAGLAGLFRESAGRKSLCRARLGPCVCVAWVVCEV